MNSTTSIRKNNNEKSKYHNVMKNDDRKFSHEEIVKEEIEYYKNGLIKTLTQYKEDGTFIKREFSESGAEYASDEEMAEIENDKKLMAAIKRARKEIREGKGIPAD